jgi:PAS domain S-box-containing protein
MSKPLSLTPDILYQLYNPVIYILIFALVGLLSYNILRPQTAAEKEATSSMSLSGKFKAKKILTTKDALLLAMLDDTYSFVVTDPSIDDNPIIYVSQGFCKVTQYAKGEILNRNCRFLQGTETERDDVEKIKDAIKNRTETSVCLLNYKKDGSKFVNQFFLCPLYSEDRTLAYYLGVQQELLERQEGQTGKNPGYVRFMWL